MTIESRDVGNIESGKSGYGLQFPEINKARTRPLRATNKQESDVETSCASYIPEPAFSFPRRWLVETPFRSDEHENNSSNLDRSQCTICWCFLVDKAPSACLPGVQARERERERVCCCSLAAKVHLSYTPTKVISGIARIARDEGTNSAKCVINRDVQYKTLINIAAQFAEIVFSLSRLSKLCYEY